jgi:hypothetical protein
LKGGDFINLKQKLENRQSEIDCGLDCACHQAPEWCECGGYDGVVAPWIRPQGTRLKNTRIAVAQFVSAEWGKVRHFFWLNFFNGKQILALREEVRVEMRRASKAEIALMHAKRSN